MYKYCFSIVSHNNANYLDALLVDFKIFEKDSFQIIITLNVPEEVSLYKYDYNFTVLRNILPKGFGSNHNAAFKHANASYFIVCNPDIRINMLNMQILLNTFNDFNCGVCAPRVNTTSLLIEDSARKFPTIGRLLNRKFLKNKLDYNLSDNAIEVDWVAGMFMMFKSNVFAEVCGFDPRYFMYCEDIDLCRRLKTKNYSIMYNPNTSIIHDARRDSRRKIRYLWWHLKSMFIFLFLSSKIIIKK